MERLVKSLEAREEARASRGAKAMSQGAMERMQFSAQLSTLTARADELVQGNKPAEAAEVLNEMRGLVQDTAGSSPLTAHEMARANQTLARLQDAIARHSTGPSGDAPARRFRFSAKPRPRSNEAGGSDSNHSHVAAEAVAPAVVQHADTQASHDDTRAVPAESAAHEDVYGPAAETTLFVRHSKAVFVRQCTHCTLLALPIAGSVFLSQCEDCTVYLACHQLRMRDCHKVRVYVCCASTPVIESCAEIAFGPYSCWSGLLQSSWQGRRLDSHEAWVREAGAMHGATAQLQTSYTKVDDFQWLKKTPSPHWRVMTAEEQTRCELPFRDEDNSD